MNADVTVFIGTDLEAQSLANSVSQKTLFSFLERHFRYACLLSEKVYMPVANIYQSDLTRTLKRAHQALFLDSDEIPSAAQFSLSSHKCKFQEDAEDKRGTYPNVKKYRIYQDGDLISKITEELSGLTPYFRGGTMNTSLESMISKEFTEHGPIYLSVLYQTGSEEETEEIFKPLLRAVQEQEYAIVPEYVNLLAQPEYLTPYYSEIYQFILLKSYCKGCSDLYHAYCNNPMVHFYQPIFQCASPYELDFRDTCLFDVFLEGVPELKQYLEQLDDLALIHLKVSPEFQMFKQSYISFVESLKGILRGDYVHALRGQILQKVEKLIKEEKENLLEDLLNFVPDYGKASLLYQTIRHLIKKGNLINRSITAVDLTRYPIHNLTRYLNDNFLEQYEEDLFQQYKRRNIQDRKEWKKMSIKSKFGSHNTIHGDINVGTDITSIKQTVGKAAEEQETELVLSGKLIALTDAELKNMEAFLRSVSSLPQEDPAIQSGLVQAVQILESLLVKIRQKDMTQVSGQVSQWRSFQQTCSAKCLEILQTLANISNIAAVLIQLFHK